MQSNGNQEKDTIILFKNYSVADSGAKSFKAGTGQRHTLRLTPEVTATLIQSLTAQLASELGQKNGVKLDIHTGIRSAEGREFAAAFGFAKATQDAPAFGGGGGRTNNNVSRMKSAVGGKEQFAPVSKAEDFKVNG